MFEVQEATTIEKSVFFLILNEAQQIDIAAFRDPTLDKDDIVFESSKAFFQNPSQLPTLNNQSTYWNKGDLIRVNRAVTHNSSLLTKVLPEDDLFNAVILAKRSKTDYFKK